MAFDYDLFVIGGGSGGVRAARVAAAEGARVALAEEDRYGGTCVIRGCVPKKLMVYASEFPQAFELARAFGWSVTDDGFSWDTFKARLNAELDRLEGVYRNLLSRSGVETYDARATMIDPHTLELSDGRRFSAQHILLAVGGRPVLPQVQGIEHVITSNEMFHLDALPKRMIIVGGGYIASEFAGIMNGLGTEVLQFYRGDQILRGFDAEAIEHVANGMRVNGVDIRTNTNVVSIEKTDQGLSVTDTNGVIHQVDQVMFATGRTPNTDGLGLEALGVELGRKGEIIVDAYSQTKVPSIYAVGDVTDRANLTPVAIREGMAFVDTLFKGVPTAPDHDLIPTAIFTQPEMGTIGLSEAEAEALEKVHVYTTSFKSMREGFGGVEERVFMKLIVSQETDKVLGCHIVAPHAGEMIQLVGIAVKMGSTKADFDRTVAVHPTMAEEMVTMRNPTRSS
ncbi:MAG: glutathione-disulfide reductase [Paracoccaceae bacterium]|jgi:glutathione reductase (NADPH)